MRIEGNRHRVWSEKLEIMSNCSSIRRGEREWNSSSHKECLTLLKQGKYKENYI